MAHSEGFPADAEGTDKPADESDSRPRFELGTGEDTEGQFLMPIIRELNEMDGQASSGSPYD